MLRSLLLGTVMVSYFLAVPLLAQTDTRSKVKVRISKDEDADSRILPVSMTPNGGSGILMLRSAEFFIRSFTTMEPRIDLYSKDKLSLLRSVKPDMQHNGSKLLTEGLVWFGGKAMFLARGMTEEGTTIYWKDLDPDLTRDPGPFMELVSWNAKSNKGRAAISKAGGSFRTPYSTRISPDSTHLLIHSPELRNKEEGGAGYLIAVVDKEMRPVWASALILDATIKRTDLLSIELDDKGVAYVLVKVMFGNKEVKDGEENFEVRCYRISASGEQRTDFKLSGEEFARTAILRTLPDGRIGCAGIYGDASDRKNPLKGNFTAFIDPAGGGLTQVKNYPFREEDAEGEPLEEGTKHEEKDADAMGDDVRVLDVLPCSDGGFYIVNERYLVTYRTDPQTGRETAIFVHGTLIVRRIEASGEVRWTTIFRRKTAFPGKYFGNVFSCVYNDDLYLFLLDSEKAAKARKEGKSMNRATMTDPHSSYVTFSETGKPRSRTVLKRDKDSDFITGTKMVSLGSGEYVALGAEKLQKARFLPVKISFSTEEK